MKIIPIILAGGHGTRLWPMSRESYPKQFLRLVSNYSLLQETVMRCNGLDNAEKAIIICNIDHYFICLDHMQEINVVDPTFILEPNNKNTAPAIACAARHVSVNYPEPCILLVLPSDHLILDQEIFFKSIQAALVIAQENLLTTFGVIPTSVETGYGYIERSTQKIHNGFLINKFIEKPHYEVAKKLIEQENYYWNSGMYLFTPTAYLDELKNFAPEVYQKSIQAYDEGMKKDDYIRLNAEVYDTCPAHSIDYLIMEKTNKAAVVPLASSWSDLGCWTAVAKAGIGDIDENVVRGNVLAKNTKNCFLSSEDGRLIAAVGLKDHIIVSTADAVLVANKDYSQEVRNLVSHLKKDNHEIVTHHKKKLYQWGFYEKVTNNDQFRLNYLMIRPGHNLLFYPSEYEKHLISISGVGKIITIQKEWILENQTILIPNNTAFNIINSGQQDLYLIKVYLTKTLESSTDDSFQHINSKEEVVYEL